MKYEPGEVVWLKSSNPDAGDAGMTVLLCHEPSGDAPPAYDLAMAAADGSNLLTFRMPEFALINAAEHHQVLGAS